MTDRWIKLLTRTRESDKVAEAVERAGLAAWAVYSGLLMLHAEFGAHGRLDASTARPGRIRMGLPAFALSADDVRRALAALEAAGLVAIEPDGALRIVGFDASVMPTCSSCRKPNPEPGKATCPDCRERFRLQRKQRQDGARERTQSHASARNRTRAAASARERLQLDKDTDTDGTHPPGCPPPASVPETREHAAAAGPDPSPFQVSSPRRTVPSNREPRAVGRIIEDLMPRVRREVGDG